MTSPAARTETPPARVAPAAREEDQRVFLPGRFEDYETILAIRGDRSVPRISYLDGVIELMSPSSGHEGVKTTLARLLETWSVEVGRHLIGVGSWTLKESKDESGVEPDECYIVGTAMKERPDLAIEVVWTRGGLKKLEIYRRLGVAEVWYRDDAVITVYRLGDSGYARADESGVLPELDLAWLASFLDRGSQPEAVLALRDALRARP